MENFARIIHTDTSDRLKLYFNIKREKEKINSGILPKYDLEYLCTEAKEINLILEKSRHKLYYSNSIDPKVYLIGFSNDQKNGQPNHQYTANAIANLAEKKKFHKYKLLCEGYRGRAILLNFGNVMFINALNNIGSKYKISPEGYDSFNLRKEENQLLNKINEESAKPKKIEAAINFYIAKYMRTFLQREIECIAIPILEEIKENNKIIYLLQTEHLLSPELAERLGDKGVSYASYVQI